jgi:flagellin-like protein
MRARRLRVNSRGLSEIVGTLMLVLIVVGAAVALAAFIASYQKQLQAEEQVTHNRNLEDLRVLSLTPSFNKVDPSNLANLTFSAGSLDIQNTTIDEISVNGEPVKTYDYWWLNPTNGMSDLTPSQVPPGFSLNVAPEEQIFVELNLTQGASNPTPGSTFSMYQPNFALSVTSFVKIELYTGLDNDFVQSFIPPTAIAVVTSIQSWTGTTYATVPVLDGSQSFQTGNETLTAWTWTVSVDNTSAIPQVQTTTYLGEKVALPGVYPPNAYFANLTVTNSAGLIGFASVAEFH